MHDVDRMRAAVIAGTHLPRGARRLPERCLAELRAADAILHAGDLILELDRRGIEPQLIELV